LHIGTRMRFYKIFVIASLVLLSACSDSSEDSAPTSKNLVVTTMDITTTEVDDVISAQGQIVAWEEAIISTRVGGLPIAEIFAEVGDVVTKGQLLAKLDDITVQLDISKATATLAEAEAAALEAKANYDKQLSLKAKKFVSEQDLLIAQARADAATARRNAAAAGLAIHKQRLADTEITAPDNGLIQSRSAVLGSMSMIGQPLFVLSRDNKIEWAAELLPEQVSLIYEGQAVNVSLSNGQTVSGSVRVVSPVLDKANKLGRAFVRLEQNADVLAGMYLSGQFLIGKKSSILLPMNTLVQRDGRTFVFVVNSNNKVAKVFVELGRQVGNKFEVLNGVSAGQTVVSNGAGFLSDGETVDINNAALGE